MSLRLKIAACVVALAAMAVHWPVLAARAVSLDDDQYVGENPLVARPGWNSVVRFFGEVLKPSSVRGYYQPLTMTSLMLDVAGGARLSEPRIFHRTSLFLHALNAALLVLLLGTLFNGVGAGVAGGLLWALHPLTVEPIAWISDRKTVLATAFALGSLLCWARAAVKYRGASAASPSGHADSERRAFRVPGIAVVLFVLALLCKPTVTPLPLLLLVLSWWPLRLPMVATLRTLLPLVLVAAVSAVITVLSQSATAEMTLPSERGALDIPHTLAHNVVFYLEKALIPAALTSHYPYPIPLAISHPRVLAGVVGTVLLAFAAGLSLRRTRSVVASLAFLFLALLPTLGIIGVTSVIAHDKYAYFPLVGLSLLAAAISGQIPKNGAVRAGAALLFLAICAAEAWATRQVISHWHTTEARLRYMLALAPDSPILHNQLGVALVGAGRLVPAGEQFHAAAVGADCFAAAWTNLANVTADQGRHGEALAFYERAIQCDRSYSFAYHNLGNSLMALGRAGEAIAYYEEALRQRPGDERIANALRVAREQQPPSGGHVTSGSQP